MWRRCGDFQFANKPKNNDVCCGLSVCRETPHPCMSHVTIKVGYKKPFDHNITNQTTVMSSSSSSPFTNPTVFVSSSMPGYIKLLILFVCVIALMCFLVAEFPGACGRANQKIKLVRREDSTDPLLSP